MVEAGSGNKVYAAWVKSTYELVIAVSNLKDLEDLRVEAGRLNGCVQRIRREIDAQKIARLACRSVLLELKLTIERMKLLFLRQWNSYVENMPSSDFLSMMVKVWGSGVGMERIEHGFASRASTIDSAIYWLDNPQTYDDTQIRRSLSDLILSTHSFIDLLDSEILAKVSSPLVGFYSLAELVGNKPFGLDERWLVANSYLSAMEIAVNKKRKELQITGKADFVEKFNQLVKALEQKGTEVRSLEKQLPSAFWKIRNEVVHEGYSPDEEELTLIVDWVKKILALLTHVP